MQAIAAKWIFALVFSFLVTAYLVPIFITLAERLRLLDEPDGKIKKQANPVPYLGGLAVYCGFLCGLALTIPLHSNLSLMLVGATLLLFIGLIDDLVVMMPYQKFFGQCLAALCFLKGGFYLKEHFFSTLWHLPLSFLWIVSIINAFNLIDVMDGLASSVAIMAAVGFFVIAYLFGQAQEMILLAALIGSLIGFFWFNRPNARIYLGDAGALFIGGILATVPFLLNWGTHTPFGFFAPIIILAIPLLELMTLIIVRTYKGIPFYRGSRDHFACYLQDKGWGKNKVLAYVFGMSVILGTSAFLLVGNTIQITQMPFLAAPFLSIWGVMLLKHR
jgi:UDP-GlcNAc:undecaprenyl-phosphate GlcNAc-1-phosphate transferase